MKLPAGARRYNLSRRARERARDDVSVIAEAIRTPTFSGLDC